MILEDMSIEELLDYYELDSVEDFEPTFYYQNLTNGYQINRKAVDNLLEYYTKKELIKIKNYNEIGIVEYVAKDQYNIINNLIVLIE